MIFQVNGHDYTKYLQDDSYNINQVNIGETWTDANHKKHKDDILKVQGSIKMAFVQISDFNQFLTDVAASHYSGYYHCTLFVVNLNTSKTIDCFIDITTDRFRPVDSNRTVNYINVVINEA